MPRNTYLSPRILFLLFAFWFVSTLLSCEDDDDANGNNGPAGTECRNDSNCPGDAVCNNGRCECIDPSAQLAPGFCVQAIYPNTFVTFDTILGCTDTTLIAFEQDPFSLTWPAGVNDQSLSAFVYDRNPNGVYSTGAALALRPGDVTVGADSIYIIRINGPDGDYCWQDNWFCKNS